MSTQVHLHGDRASYPPLGKEEGRYRMRQWSFFRPLEPWGLTPLPPGSLSQQERARWEAAVAAGLLPQEYRRLVSWPLALANVLDLLTALVLLLQGQSWPVVVVLALMMVASGGYLLLCVPLRRAEHSVPWDLLVAEELTQEEQSRFALALNLLSVEVLVVPEDEALPPGQIAEGGHLLVAYAQEREFYLQQLLRLPPEGRGRLLDALTRRSQVALWLALPSEASRDQGLVLRGRYASERYGVGA